MPDELIDIVDASGLPAGVSGKREAHRRGLWHHVFHCWLYRVTPSGEARVILQRRGPNKKVFPHLYDISAAGHYTAGEGVADGVREVAEELGLAIDFSDLTDLGTRPEVFRVGKIDSREFCRTFVGRISESPSEMRPSAPEVAEVVEISAADGLALCSGATAEVAGVRHAGDGWRPFFATIVLGDLVPRAADYYAGIFGLCGKRAQR